MPRAPLLPVAFLKAPKVLGVRMSVFELGEAVYLQQALTLFSVVGTPHPSIKAASSPLAGSVA